MEIYLTPRARENYKSVKEYIKLQWGQRIADEFTQKTDGILQLLKNYPQIGKTEKDDIRGFQLSEHTRILYRVRNEKLIIVAFFDVRQSPDKKF